MSKPLLIGRDKSCDLVLESPLVSRFHAQLEGTHLQDLRSANGIFVDGKQVKEQDLEDGQIFGHLRTPVCREATVAWFAALSKLTIHRMTVGRP